MVIPAHEQQARRVFFVDRRGTLDDEVRASSREAPDPADEVHSVSSLERAHDRRSFSPSPRNAASGAGAAVRGGRHVRYDSFLEQPHESFAAHLSEDGCDNRERAEHDTRASGFGRGRGRRRGRGHRHAAGDRTGNGSIHCQTPQGEGYTGGYASSRTVTVTYTPATGERRSRTAPQPQVQPQPQPQPQSRSKRTAAVPAADHQCIHRLTAAQENFAAKLRHRPSRRFLETSLGRRTVSELKALLAEHGETSEGCIEKSELVHRAVAAIERSGCADYSRTVICVGPAGSGKTMIAASEAVEWCKAGKRVVLTRPMVAVAERQVGALPGSLEQKLEPWLRPALEVS